MDFSLTPLSTCSVSWLPYLDYVLPPVGALLSATALWVAARARSISKDAQSTSSAAVTLSLLPSEPYASSESPPLAPDPRKSSTRATTSTSPGDAEAQTGTPKSSEPDA